MIKVHRRSWKVKEGHRWSFPISGMTFQVRKVMGGGAVVVCGGLFLLDYSVSPSSSPFPLDFGFGIWDLYLGLDSGKLRNFLTCKLEGDRKI